MKSKFTLIAILIPILALAGCNDTEDTKSKNQDQSVKKEQGCRSLCGTKMPEFTVPGGNGPTNFEKGMQR